MKFLNSYIENEQCYASSELTRSWIGGRTEKKRFAKRWLRYAFFVVLMVMGGIDVWGQSSATLPNGDGYYYIINMEGGNGGHAYDKDKADNWYLCPTEGTYDYLYWQGNHEMPFLTTQKEGRKPKYLWRVVRNGDYYYIIHDLDGKYLTDNTYPGGDDKDTRRRVHIQKDVTANALFLLKESGESSGTSTYNIYTKTYGDGYYLNPANNNQPNYGQNNNKAGLIGFYSDNNGSKWFFEFVEKCVTPEITVDGSDNVTITGVTSGATIYYTLDNSDPATSGTRSEYTAAFPLGTATKIKAIAVKSGMDNSDEALYSSNKCQQPTIVLNKENGLTTITPHSDDSGANIYYTIDGSTPTTSSTAYTEPFTLSVDAIEIKAIAAYAVDGSDASDVAEQTLTQLAPPTFSKSGATVTISMPTKESDGTTAIVGSEDVSVRYNLNNNAPTSGSTLYSGAITLPIDFNQTIIKAVAFKPGYIKSDVASQSIDKCAVPTIINSFDGTVTLSCDTEGATIRYTTSNTLSAPGNPDKNSTAVSGPITLSDTKIIKARAFKEGFAQSDVLTYTLPKFPMPKITTDGTMIHISCKSGGTIYYSTSESATPTTSYPDGGFSAEGVAVVRAYATHIGYLNSDVKTWIPAKLIDSADDVDLDDPDANYIINGTFSGTIGTADKHFKGTIDGQGVVISGLSAPLVAYAEGATIKNVILDNVSISSGSTVNVGGEDKVATGAIVNVATGDTRIYNCGVLASGCTVGIEEGYTIIKSNNSSTVSGSDYVGGIAGFLDGSSRVINCFSYANITAGSYVGGIVGWNNVATNSNASDTDRYLKTMVMNCMFYGDITGSDKAPIYNGEIISNSNISNKKNYGVSNFNYFSAEASYVKNKAIDTYNCALMAETRYLQRFEFFRHLLNSNRSLAAWWATGDADNKDEMMKWVLEPSQKGTSTPYPILKAPYDDENEVIQYPSVVNIDAAHAEAISEDAATAKTQRNQGRKLGTLSVTIVMGDGDQFEHPTGASITVPSRTLNITDKDSIHFNFNYGKVQLPYYNDVGMGNYTGYRVVTGWKITSITTDGSVSSYNSFATGSEATANAEGVITAAPYNFADRHCTQKDLYSKGDRIFNQGAYWDVPEGVTAITISPYWAQAVYCADNYLDEVYDAAMSTKSPVETVGGGKLFDNGALKDINGSNQKVYNTMSSAKDHLTVKGNVYDNAIVLVGNVHSNALSSDEKNKPYTIMSIDLDKDNEPDYSYILRFDSRKRLHPVRVDFLNVIGLGMAQKSTGGTGTYNLGIMQPYGWFEVTNTGLFRVTQLEYDLAGRVNSPMILQGGVIEQWVTVGGKEETIVSADAVSYYHVGGNAWFKEFHIGVHQDKIQDQFVSPHPPISVTGGDFDIFYLTGYYNSPNNSYPDNAECYINGGRFGKVAGTGVQGLGKPLGADDTGNIIWQIDNADIDEFYAGGINAAHIAEGNITTVISNSRVDLFCGGPKFGDMNSNKKVFTTATNCTFRAFFGAGYGGNSYNRRYPKNQNNKININWNSWVQNGGTFEGESFEGYKNEYLSQYGGVGARIDYQFIPMSNNTSNVARLFVDYVSFSLATTYDVTSKLTGCTITRNALGRLKLFDQCIGNFYGGGSLGKVAGPVKSTLTNCTVEGNVFGAGYSASLPDVEVMNNSFQTEPRYDEALGVYFDAKLPTTVAYSWEYSDTPVSNTATAINTTSKKLYTNVDLSKTNLGSVSGAVTLTIATSGEGGTTTIGTNGVSTTGYVYGGGDESAVNNTTTPANASTTVTIKGNTTVHGDVYGGGNRGVVSGTTTVNIQD